MMTSNDSDKTVVSVGLPDSAGGISYESILTQVLGSPPGKVPKVFFVCLRKNVAHYSRVYIV